VRPFNELTERGKARRLRPLASAALQRYDIDVERLELVSNDLNGIFRVRTMSSTSYLLRICLPDHHAVETIRSEAIWLDALADEPDIHAPRVIPARNGDLIVTASAAGVPEPRWCVLFSWLPGRDLLRSPSPERFADLGRLMARLHVQSRAWTPPTQFSIRTLDQLYPFGDPDGLLRAGHGSLLAPDTRRHIEDMQAAIEAELSWLYTSRAPLVVHADLHWGNVKLYRGRLQPLDFEDLAWGHPIQDVAISLFYSLGNPRFPDLQVAFRDGYSDIQAWPEEYPGQLGLLIVHRGLDLFNYLLSVDFPGRERWFPAFIDAIHGPYRDLLACAHAKR
jgi:Ser/Thr protein kinase RdoA (MazF antagonist)